MFDNLSTSPHTELALAAESGNGNPTRVSAPDTSAEPKSAAQAAQLANPRACLPAIADPSGPLAYRLARSMVEAGFAPHFCLTAVPRCHPGGVCLLPVYTARDSRRQRVVVSWTTLDVLSQDPDRAREHDETVEVMNEALCGILQTLGYSFQSFGPDGAWLVTAHGPAILREKGKQARTQNFEPLQVAGDRQLHA